MSLYEIEEMNSALQHEASIIYYCDKNKRRTPCRVRRRIPSKMVISERDRFEIVTNQGVVYHFNGFDISKGVLPHVKRRAKRRFKGESNEPTCNMGN